jgi:hypothetical protein
VAVTNRTQKIPKPAVADSASKSREANGDPARPLGKSSDPAFTKFTTYIRKTTHRAAKMRLVGEDRELSDLVEDLLSQWLKENGSSEDVVKRGTYDQESSG